MSRAFLCGNGPSLADVDLLELKDHGLVVCCNLIHKHPTEWERGFRPDVYVYGDNYGQPDPAGIARRHILEGYDCWIKSDILQSVCNEKMEPEERFWWPGRANVHPYQNCVHRRDMNPPSGWHPPHICNFTGAANAMAQVAVWKYDVDEVVWLGIDGNITKGQTGNHMADDYQAAWYGPPVVDRINDELDRGHTIIASELAAVGIPAVNCTPNSAFNQYPKMELEDVLQMDKLVA